MPSTMMRNGTDYVVSVLIKLNTEEHNLTR